VAARVLVGVWTRGSRLDQVGDGALVRLPWGRHQHIWIEKRTRRSVKTDLCEEQGPFCAARQKAQEAVKSAGVGKGRFMGRPGHFGRSSSSNERHTMQIKNGSIKSNDLTVDPTDKKKNRWKGQRIKWLDEDEIEKLKCETPLGYCRASTTRSV
jgi:hypothetical protein